MRVKCFSAEEFQVFTSFMLTQPPRNRTICSLMIFCGLRVGEVCSLNWGDVMQSGFILNSIYIRAINSKTGVPRHMPIPAPCKDALEDYQKKFAAVYDASGPTDPLFITLNAKGRICPRDIQHFIDLMTKNALGVKYSPHTLRHTYADRLLASTNIRVVQMLLGHKSLASTQIYTHPNSVALKAACDRTFPREV